MVDTKVRIVNKHGEDVSRNGEEIGEIIVKGKGVTSDELTNVSQDGWLYTGDFGTMDEDGRIKVVKSNQDVNGNEDQISTFEIESILIYHPAVQEVSVIPQPDEEVGEIAHAFVVLAPNHHIDKNDLFKHIKHELSFDTPVEISFMDELPKTSSGKILKTQLGKN